MDRSIPEILALLAIAVMGLMLLGFLGFAFTFGAADNTQVTFEADRLTAAEVVENVTYDPPRQVQPLVNKTTANGSSRTVTIDAEPYFEDAPPHQIYGEGTAEYVYIEQDGTFYRLGVTDTTEVETSHYTLELVSVNGTRGDVIAFDELPTADQRVVNEAYVYWVRGCGSTSDEERAPPCWRPYSSQAANESILVPTPSSEYIRHENQTFEIVVRERMVNARALTYESMAVANDSDVFRSVFVTTVDEDQLTEDENKLLEQAIDGGYHIQVSRHDFKQVPRELFNSLLPKLGLPKLDALSGGHQGSAVGYIDYQGVYFRVKIVYSDTYA